jgi:protein associated with RNAse G/E
MSGEGGEDGDGDGGGSEEADPSGNGPRVRVRGIYATALTRLFGTGASEVVLASEPIRDRFDAGFDVAPPDATVSTTGDRQGVGVVGGIDAVRVVRERLDGVGIDTLSWTDPTPAGAVFEGVVTDTLGGGCVVDLGEGEGYLAYDDAEGYVEGGDALRVQVREPAPPWGEDRPALSTDLVVDGGLVELRRGASGGGGTGNSEAARMASLLSVDPPDGWVPRWTPPAEDADMDALRAALERANDRADAVTRALAEADPDTAPARLITPLETVWVWFGRESRFALDDRRREVTTTMPGHHRTKAATDAASAAVDFAEAVCEPSGEFPFAAVTRQFGPREGDRIAIEHGKPEGRLITLGRGDVVEYDPDGAIRVEREMTPGGSYDALGVERRSGDVAATKFVEGRWWYATVYRDAEGETRGTYVNVCTPLELFPGAVRYVDLHVDVVKHADGRVERVDDDELGAAVEAGNVPERLAERARQVAGRIENAL